MPAAQYWRCKIARLSYACKYIVEYRLIIYFKKKVDKFLQIFTDYNYFGRGSQSLTEQHFAAIIFYLQLNLINLFSMVVKNNLISPLEFIETY